MNDSNQKLIIAMKRKDADVQYREFNSDLTYKIMFHPQLIAKTCLLDVWILCFTFTRINLVSHFMSMYSKKNVNSIQIQGISHKIKMFLGYAQSLSNNANEHNKSAAFESNEFALHLACKKMLFTDLLEII
ncbi:hypothetical protein RF11_08206 [Thelohanellus kitauei]|uniref:Uncharacterized protein n=1 Tax=Thelohanellus kitauei TaxID=669202 RepID=A0A0C2NBV1_THEKT|nr:hypothetical protein RF11_08206 [Thelohanellus kitauei]